MTYELIQAALTNLITFTAIAGFGGCIARAIWTSHRNWMRTYCPPVAAYTPDTQAEETKVDNTLESPDIPSRTEQPAIADLWEGEGEMQPQPQRLSSRHFSPILALPAARELPALKAATKRGRKPKAQQTKSQELGLEPPSGWGLRPAAHPQACLIGKILMEE